MEITRKDKRILLTAQEVRSIANSFEVAEKNLFPSFLEIENTTPLIFEGEYSFLYRFFAYTIYNTKVCNAFKMADKAAQIEALEIIRDIILSFPQKQQDAIKAVVQNWDEDPETAPEKNSKAYRQTQYYFSKTEEYMREKIRNGLDNRLLKILARNIYVKIAEEVLTMEAPPPWLCSRYEWKHWQFFIRRNRKIIRLTAEEIVDAYIWYTRYKTEWDKQYKEESKIEEEMCNQKQVLFDAYRHNEAFNLPYPQNLLLSTLYTSYRREVRVYEEMSDEERKDIIAGLVWEITTLPQGLAGIIQLCYKKRMTPSEAANAIGYKMTGAMVAEYKLIAEDLLKKVYWPHTFGLKQVQNRLAMYSCRKELREKLEEFDSYYQMSRRYYHPEYHCPHSCFTVLDAWPYKNEKNESVYPIRCNVCNKESWLTTDQINDLARNSKNCGCLSREEMKLRGMGAAKFGAAKIAGSYFVEDNHCVYPVECLKCGNTFVARGIDLLQSKIMSCPQCKLTFKEGIRIGRYDLTDEQRNGRKGMIEVRCFDTKTKKKKWVPEDVLYQEYVEKGQEVIESLLTVEAAPYEETTPKERKTEDNANNTLQDQAMPSPDKVQIGFMKLLPEVVHGMERKLHHVCCVICNKDRWIYEDDLFKHRKIHCDKCTPSGKDTYIEGLFVTEDIRTTKQKILCKTDTGEYKKVLKEYILRAVADEMLARKEKASVDECTGNNAKKGGREE